jgi:hypothetical protein
MTVRDMYQMLADFKSKKTLPEIENWRVNDLIETLCHWIDTFSSAMGDTSAMYIALQGMSTTLNSLQTQVNSLQLTVSGNSANLITLASNLSTLQNTVTTIQSNIASMQTTDSNLAAALAALQASSISALSRVDVSLTATGQTTNYTVPAGKTLIITGCQLLGKTAVTGVLKAATIKVGTQAGSYAELLGALGITFDTTLSSTLLAVNKVIEGFVVGSASLAKTAVFAAGTVIKSDVSGAALPGTGIVTVIPCGYLI